MRFFYYLGVKCFRKLITETSRPFGSPGPGLKAINVESQPLKQYLYTPSSLVSSPNCDVHAAVSRAWLKLAVEWEGRHPVKLCQAPK